MNIDYASKMKPNRLLLPLAKGFAQVLLNGPVWLRKAAGACFSFLWFDIFRIRRKTMYENLELAFPSYTQGRRSAIALGFQKQMGMGVIESMMIPAVTKEWVEAHFEFRGENFHREALSQKKGVLLLSMHLGSTDLSITAISLHGIKLNLITKIFSISWLNNLWFGLRANHGTQFIQPHGAEAAFQILKALKRNESVIFVLDQYMGVPYGVETLFFNKPTGTAYGLALMALKTGAPVVPVFAYTENSSGKHVVEFLPAIPLEEKSTRDSTIKHMTQVYTTAIEKIVLQHPDQWMWIHRRWKPVD